MSVDSVLTREQRAALEAGARELAVLQLSHGSTPRGARVARGTISEKGDCTYDVTMQDGALLEDVPCLLSALNGDVGDEVRIEFIQGRALVTGVVATASNRDKIPAPTNHASTGTGYGVGNGSNYGHLKLSDSTTSASGVGGGTAATPAAVKAVRDSLSQLNGKRVSTGITGVTGYRFGNYLLLQIERTGVNVSAGKATTLGTLPSNLRGSKGVAAATTSLGKVGARIFVETDGRVGIAASSAAAISGDNVFGQVSSLLNTVA